MTYIRHTSSPRSPRSGRMKTFRDEEQNEAKLLHLPTQQKRAWATADEVSSGEQRRTTRGSN